MSDKEPIKIIADIIQTELELEDGQVMLYNQRFQIPSTSGIYIVLSNFPDKIISSNNYFDNDLNKEVQSITGCSTIQIDIMSADNTARLRRFEVLAALKSIYSEQQQTENEIKIYRIPSNIMNVAAVEESTILFRYTFTIAVNFIYNKVKDSSEYFDKFQSTDIRVNQ